MIDPSPRMVTVFGGGGFIGRYVCEALLRSRVQLRVACRDPRRAWFLKPLGEVGRVTFAAVDLKREESVAAACERTQAVINLVGVLKGNFHAAHVAGAEAVALAAARAGAEALVHVSAIGADPQSASAYARSKGEGEAAIRSAFPTATIIRPSLVFGREDQLTNCFASLARLPVLPVIAPRTRFQPIHVADLAAAIAAAALDPEAHGSRTYELGGPEVMTMRELNQTIAAAAGRSPELVDVPDFVAAKLALLGFLPGAPLTRDQWLMLQRDNVAAPGAKGLAAFGIRPTPFGAVAPDWLGMYGGSRFARRRVNITAIS